MYRRMPISAARALGGHDLNPGLYLACDAATDGQTAVGIGKPFFLERDCSQDRAYDCARATLISTQQYASVVFFYCKFTKRRVRELKYCAPPP